MNAPRVVRGFTVHADGTIVGPSGRVLKSFDKWNGYLVVTRGEAGKRVHEYVHRLVCEAFHGPAPADKPMALHRDGNPTNNRAGNLYWGDPRENCADRGRHGTTATGERHGQAKLTQEQVAEIRAYPPEVTHADLGRKYGVHYTTVSRIRNGQRWKEVRP